MMSTKDLKVDEITVRLTQADGARLRQLAHSDDIPPAVLARAYIRRGLNDAEDRSSAIDFRRAA